MKTKTPLEKLLKAFNEDYNDNELQQRYDNFVSNVKRWKAEFNEIVIPINAAIKERDELTEIIFQSALHGILVHDVIDKFKKISYDIDDMAKNANNLKELFTKKEELMKRYKEGSENKLFHWWRSIKAIEPCTKPWLEWRTPYMNRIF